MSTTIFQNVFNWRILLMFSFFARYEQDLPRGRKKEKVSILSPDIEDVFGMKLHQMEKTSCLVGKSFYFHDFSFTPLPNFVYSLCT